jgi:hypothetical protein
MKKTILMALLPLIFLQAIAQKEGMPEKKFQLGIGFGVGVFTVDGLVITTSAELQGEVKISNTFSLSGMMAYNRLFGNGESVGYTSLLVGPRIWFSKKFFIGTGAGLAYYGGADGSGTLFNYNPHIGLNNAKTQFTIGYNALSSDGVGSGFVQFRGIVKFK